ncbi:MAG: hypothetical protein KatS3mg011_1770 [Acidimicrobiia bacterium]|nr:MAG: hypothetical protein KatS3mg011_1770 [Acidimicrobiia bacterium]
MPAPSVVLDLDALKTTLGGLTMRKRTALASELRRLALHMADRIHYAEGRRTSFVTIGGALVAAGYAILALPR